MTPSQVTKIQGDLAEVQRRRDDAGTVFYEHLFSNAPQLRSMFPDDMVEQERKLMTTLALAVATLNDWPTLHGVLLDLGRRHRAFGVRNEHYEPVGRALIAMLGTVLGPNFDEDAKERWTTLYASVRGVMTSAEAPATRTS